MAETKRYQSGTKKFLTGISISHEEKAIVDGVKEQHGISSFSLALGMIIREWSEMKKQYITVPVAGVIRGETVEEDIERRR